MTDLLYYDDAYLKSTEATVTAVLDNGIILDRTVFYPECGGQPGDRGTFGPYAIIDTQKAPDGTPVHIIDGSKPASGETFTLSLDWNHRYKYMKEHSAQHLISATMFNEFGISTVAVHQGERILTVETDKPEISDEVLFRIEDSVNEHVREGHRIYHKVVDHESAERLNMRRSIKVDGDVMLIYIDGIDVVACGGVHAGNTRELGEIHYAGKELIRGHIRTIWRISEEAVKERRENERILHEACTLLSSAKEKLPSDIERLIASASDLKRQIRLLSAKAAEREYNDNSASADGPFAFSTDLPADFFQNLPAEGDEAFIVSGSSFIYHGPKEHFAHLKEELGLRGGGRGLLYRGSFTGEPDEIIKAAISIMRRGV